MELVELLNTLKKQKIHLTVIDSKLTYKAPKGAINIKIKDSLKAHKSTLIELFGGASTESILPEIRKAPLTTAQKQIWIAYHALPEQQALEQYHVTFGFDTNIQLDLERITAAIRHTIATFDALNLGFELTDEGIYQCYQSSDPIIELISLDSSELSCRTSEIVSKRFDLLKDKLYRIVILKTGEDIRIVWCFHHILCDGYSLSIISNMLLRHYKDLDQALPHRSDESKMELRYLNYAYQQKDKDLDLILNEWLMWFRGIEPKLWLKQADCFRRDSARFASKLETEGDQESLHKLHSFEFLFERNQAHRIDNHAHSFKISTFEYLLSVYCILVHQLTNQPSFCVSIPESGRTSNTVDTVGLFATGRLLPVICEPEESLDSQIENVVAQIRHGLHLPQIPTEFLLSRLKSEEKIAIENDGYLQLGFSYYHDTTGVLTTEPIRFEGIQFTPLQLERSDHRKKMSLLIHRSGDQLKLEWHFRQSEISEQLAKAHCDLFNQLILNLNYGSSIRNRRQLPSPEWRNTQRRLLETQIRNAPVLHLRNENTQGLNWLFGLHKDQDIAIRFAFNSDEQTYGTLKSQVDQLSRYFYKLGVRSGQRVYLDLKRSHRSLVATLAIWNIGAVYCPLNIGQPMAKKLVIVASHHVLTSEVSKWPKAASTIDINAAFIDSRDLIPQLDGSEATIEHEWQANDPFYHLQTSGTTGDSKAVEVTFSNILHYLAGAIQLYDIKSKKHVLHHTELSFDVSMVELLIGFYSGGCMTIYEGGLMDAGKFSKLLRDHEIDTVSLTASHWQRLVASPDFVLDSNPRQFKVGAEPLPAVVAEIWLQRFGISQELFNVYGPSETTVGITGKRITQTKGFTFEDQVTIGTNFIGYTLVCDPYGKPLPPDNKGELWIMGPTVSNGYVDNIELTNKVFFNLIVGSEEIRGYKSGDLVVQRPDKHFFIFGRKDHQIKWRGYRIELNAIELCLEQAVTVRRCVLVPSYNDKGHIERLSAVIMLDQNEIDSIHIASKQLMLAPNSIIKTLSQHLLDSLPEYMMPSNFLLTENLPLRVSGKLDRRELRHWLDQFDQVSTNNLDGQMNNGKAVNSKEVSVADVWKKILKQTSIDTQKNFFDHGGHSLLLLDALHLLNKKFSVNIELVDLFEHTTVHQIAGHIESLLREKNNARS